MKESFASSIDEPNSIKGFEFCSEDIEFNRDIGSYSSFRSFRDAMPTTNCSLERRTTMKVEFRSVRYTQPRTKLPF